MKLDFDKIFRIGIDRIVFSNINFEYPTAAISIEGEDWIGEKVKITEDTFILEKTSKLKDTGEYSETSYLTINPGRILYGNNVVNARGEELREALKHVLDRLEEQEVSIDISEAVVNEIEININFQVVFEEYVQVLSLLFLNLQNLRKISNHQKTKSYKELFRDSTLDGGWQNHGVRAYDKREELKKYGEELEFDLLRIEWWLLSSSYKYYANKFGRENTLKALLEDDTLIDDIFSELCLKKLFQEGYEYLEKKLIPNLEVEYLKFKKGSKLARETGRKVPRNVYKYLEEKCWVFDYLDLIDLIKKHDKRHSGREIKRIKENYFHLNNKEKLSYLVEKILHH
jgi:hypothetical protein